MKNLLFSLCLFISVQLSATDIGGVINQYSKVLSNGGCLNSLKVANPELFMVDEEVIIIQMQGALIDESNTASFGTITDLNNTGNFERAKILEIINDTIYFNSDLVKPYDYSAKVQIVSLPNYDEVTITSTLTCEPWNGETGGVLALFNNGTTTFNDSIDVSGKGFRGGLKLEGSGNSCSWIYASTSYFYLSGSWEGANKGEGVALTPAGKEFGMGPLANGGGGGNDHNSGGAGGANGASGGKGGENDDPALFSCTGYNPGIEGRALSYNENVTFMGGGGGAGHGNNNLSSAGGNGGGIVILFGNDLAGPHQVINAKGNNALITGGGDGAGAGGAGGSVLLTLLDFGTELTVNLNGGNGGSVDDEFYNRCHGPGGGGSGGVLRTSKNLVGVNVLLNGGNPGLITNSTATCNNTNGGAINGEAGLIQQNLTVPMGEFEIECLITQSKQVNQQLVKVFPNPSYRTFNIQSIDHYNQIEIYDAKGRLLESLKNKNSFGDELPAGIYFLKVKSNTGIQTTRLIKSK